MGRNGWNREWLGRHLGHNYLISWLCGVLNHQTRTCHCNNQILCLPILWWLSLLKDLSALSFASVLKAVVVSLTVITACRNIISVFRRHCIFWETQKSDTIFITSQTQSVQDYLAFSKWSPDQCWKRPRGAPVPPLGGDGAICPPEGGDGAMILVVKWNLKEF